MVCIICFDVFALIKFLKHDRQSSEVTKPMNNPNMMYAIFHWLELVRPCIAQKCLDSNPASLKRTIDSHSINHLLLQIQVLRCLQKQIALGCINKNKVLSKRTLTSHRLNQLLHELQALRCL